jgi:hypothetical protein
LLKEYTEFLVDQTASQKLVVSKCYLRKIKKNKLTYNLLAMIRLKMKPKTNEKLLAIASTLKIIVSFSGT